MLSAPIFLILIVLCKHLSCHAYVSHPKSMVKFWQGGPLLPPKDQNVLLWLWIKAPFDDCHPCEYSKPQRVVLFWKVNFVTKFMFIPKQSLEVYSGGLYENIIMENMWMEYEIAWQIEFSSSNLYNRIKMIHSNTYKSAVWWLQELAFTWLGVSCSVET